MSTVTRKKVAPRNGKHKKYDYDVFRKKVNSGYKSEITEDGETIFTNFTICRFCAKKSYGELTKNENLGYDENDLIEL